VNDDPGMLAGIATTRSIRRYRDEPVTDDEMATLVWHASRAPTGSNRQGFRFVVLRTPDADDESERASATRRARTLLGDGARRSWAAKRAADGYDRGSGADTSSPKARMARTMERYVEELDRAPVIVLPCAVLHRDADPTLGASLYPAVQNLLLAARAIGLGGVLTMWHRAVEDDLRAALAIPDDVFIGGCVTLGRPAGSHGPVRRRPLGELVHEGRWGDAAAWAVDPPGTRFTSAGPPKAQ